MAYDTTIDESGIVAASETVTAGTMTLFDGGGAEVGTLAVNPTLGTSDFTLIADGSGGTDVITTSIYGTYASGVTLLTNPTSITATGNISDSTSAAIEGPAGTNWTLTNSGTVSETNLGGSAVDFVSAGTVVNAASGVIASSNSSGIGVKLEDGGEVTNQSGGTISGDAGVYALNAAATVVNAGSIYGNGTGSFDTGVNLLAGGAVTNQSGGSIAGYADGVKISGGSGTVVNQGDIHTQAGGPAAGGGVYLGDGGAVTNGASGSTVSSAYIGGYRYGVKFGAGGAGTLTNFGTVSGVTDHPAVLMTTGTIVNGPSGATGALIRGGDQASAVLISGAGTVVNYGTILGTELSGANTGIYFGISLGGGGSISNLGAQSLISDYVAVYAGSGATVTNAGTIASQTSGAPGPAAVVFGGGTNRLIIDPGAVFVGAVSGSGPVTLAPAGNTQVIGTQNGIGTTTMELASGASTGVLNGVGSKYVGFAAIEVDTGANWDLGGGNTLASGVTLTDNGTLTVTGTLLNNGAITGASQGIVLGSGAVLTNQLGSAISGPNAGVAGSGAGTLINAGYIGDVADTRGVYFAAGGSVTNQSGGTIAGNTGVFITGAAGSADNAGLIKGNDVNGAGVAINGGGSVTNAAGGTISGYKAISGSNTAVTVVNAGSLSGSYFGVYLTGGSSVTNQTGGVINGDEGVLFTSGGGTVVNYGTIQGGSDPSGRGIALAGSGTIINQVGGTIAGRDAIHGPTGLSVSNAGDIAGQVFGVYQNGGTISNLSGGAISGGIDAVKFAAGYDSQLIIAPGATFTGLVDGGNDLTASSVSTLELASVSATGTLTGLGSQFVHFAQVTVDAGATWAISAGAYGFSTLTNAGTLSNGLSLGAGSFTVSNQSTGTIAGGVGGQGALTVTNEGSIGGVNTGVSVGSGGVVTNAAGGVISGNIGVYVQSGSGSVVNAGSIGATSNYGVLLLSGGTVTNQSTGRITGPVGVELAGDPGTVVNAGYIGGTGTGVWIRAGGTLVNQSGGTIAGTSDAVSFASGATNRLVLDPGATFIGTVDGGNLVGDSSVSTLELGSAASAGTISGLGSQFVNFAQVTVDAGAQWSLTGDNTLVAGATLGNAGTLATSGTLTNAGTITGGSLDLAGGALTNQAGGLISNSTISGNGSVLNSGSIGADTGPAIYLSASGSVTNAEGAQISGGIGVQVGLDSTVTNAGTIASNLGSAGTAVAFEGGNARLIDDPGAVFTGSIDGGAGGTATFELASGSSAGIVSGFGGSIANFGTLAFDAGSQWTVAGSFAGGVAIQGFGLGDTIDVAGFAAVSRSYDSGSHQLVLDDGLGDFETLDIQGTFSTTDFHIQTVGGTTEVMLQQVPTIVAGATATFMGGNPPATLDGGLTVVDPGSAVLVGATIAINGGFVLGDMLDFTGTGSITGSYDTNTGVLTLSGTDTVADYQAALDSITYSFSPSNGDPTGGGMGTGRSISWSVDDGFNVSNLDSSTLSVVHTPPTIAAGASVAFAGGDGPIVLDGSLTVADADSGDILVGATIAITGGFASGDLLNFTDQGGITGSYDAGTGSLVLSGPADVAAYQAALESITFSISPTDSDPTVGGADTSRTITWTVDDGVNTASDTSTLTASHTAPSVTVGGTVAFAAGGSVATTLAPDLTVSDPDSSGVLTGATIVVGGFVLGDVLSFTNTGSITGSFDGDAGTLVLSGVASLADYQTALESITFSSSVETAGSRTIGWTIDDGIAGSSSGISTVDVTRDGPTITGVLAGQATTDEMAISPFAGVVIGDPNIGQTETVTITLSDASSGALSDLGGGVFNAGTYVVSGTTDQVTQAVDGLVFTPVPHSVEPGNTVTTTFTLQVTDSNGVTTSDGTTSVVATATNDAPTITHSSVSAGVPNTGTVSAGTTPFSGVTVTDPDIGHVDTVTVTMGAPGEGAFSNLSGGTYDTDTGIYTFVGTPSDVTAALAVLEFTGTPPGAGTYVATTNFGIVVTGPGGSASDNAISVSTVAQNAPGLGSGASSNTISVSSDGSNFAPATGGQTNEAIVSGPVNGGTYTLPSDYQAIYLGGTTDATLSDNSVGNAVLIGNGGNDTIVAGADNDTLSGGGGTNTFIASGSSDIISASGTATVQTSGTNDVVYGNENLVTVTDNGSGNAIGLGLGDANLTLTGTNASVFANSGSVVLSDSGTGTAIGAYSGSITATLSGSGTALYGSTGDMSVIVSDTASNVAIGQGLGNATIVAGGDNTTVFGGAGTLDVTIQNTATNAAIGTGSGTSTVSLSGDDATVFGGSGSLVATVSGRNDLIGLSDGAASITLSGADAIIYGGSGAMSVLDQGTGDIIAAGTGSTTVTADGQDGEVIGGGGSLNVIAGTGSDTIFGGSGTTTITGGSGQLTMLGSAGGTMTFIGGSGSAGSTIYLALDGTETFDGSAATASLVMEGGLQAGGNDTLIGGAGNDYLYAGESTDTMTGGGGDDQFIFSRSIVAGAAPADVITDFNANDQVYLLGYGSSEAANALAHATSNGGSTTLTLSDSTRITFQGVGSASALSGHLFAS
ncbi:MAG TPA: hypothetical protein VFG62_13975 [Rhodopila sp.]|nr:hypothetical protein [Rhodopila sp.]